MDVKSAQPLLEKLLLLARKRHAVSAESVWCSTHSSSFAVCDDDLEKSRTAVISRVGLRVLDSANRQGVASLGEFDDDAVSLLCDMAFKNAEYSVPESDVVFVQHQPAPSLFDLGIYDSDLAVWSAQKQIDLCLEMSCRARSFDKRIKKVRASEVETFSGESLTLNSYGVSVYSRSTAGSAGLTLIAEDDGAAEIGGAVNDGRSLSSLTACLPVEEAVERTVRMLHGTPLPSGRYTLVLEPSVAAEFVSVLSELFSAENVCKRLTLLNGKMGQSVASEVLTLVDDGRLYGGLGTAACDSECVETRRTTVVDHGRLSAWLCNLQYGRRLGLPSTGNGSRGLSSLPEVDVNNFFVLPGVRSAEDIIASHDGCFCVTELMGLHTADTVTGDFSLAARGLYYKDGILAPVSSVTIAGNLTEFLKKIIEVGGDLRFFGRFGGCTMVVDDIAVAGK
jgi:PmbA protein